MTLYVVKLKKATLQAMSDDERELLFSLTHLADEVRALQKLYLWSVQGHHTSEAEADGELFVSLFLVKSLAGKLFEGYYQILVKCFIEKPLYARYRKLMKTEGRRALTSVRRYFEKKNNLASIIRNQFAFHYSPKKYGRMLPKLGEQLKLYMQDGGNANNLYYFSELLAITALLHEIPARGNLAALKRLNADMRKILSPFVLVCDSLIAALLGAHVPNIWEENVTVLQLENLKPFEEIDLPWFSETSNLGKEST